MRYGSLFSGIGGLDLAFEQAGFDVIWQVEKDKFCKKVLARHWPKVRRYSDVRRVGAKVLEPVEVITAGVPCQDVSIAGSRRGLAGKHTGLVYHFARILQELRPGWFVFENVPGLFSSNEGRDFAEVLRLFMVECGYGVSWRVLDSRYFNVAQRRERVFVVGRLGRPCPAEILFECEGGGWNLTTRRETRTDIAVPLTSGSGGSSNAPGRRQEDDFNIVKQAISAKWAKGTSGPSGDEHHNLVASTIRSEYGEQCFRGDGTDNFVFESRFARNGRGAPDTIVPPLKAESGRSGKGDGAPLLCFDTTQLTHPANGANPQPGEPCHPLSARAHAPAIAGTLGSLTEGFRTTDLDGSGAFICSPSDADRMRETPRLPRGLDSARYRALGNAVTVSVARWIAERLRAWIAAHSEN
jgi:DNA (cytosine-5)-methyltransferase 1